jgi:hypothetical protein
VNGTNHVQGTVVFFVEMIVHLQDVTMVHSFHGLDLLLHSRESVTVVELEHLRGAGVGEERAGEVGVPWRRISPH